jgi:histone H3/H4
VKIHNKNMGKEEKKEKKTVAQAQKSAKLKSAKAQETVDLGEVLVSESTKKVVTKTGQAKSKAETEEKDKPKARGAHAWTLAKKLQKSTIPLIPRVCVYRALSDALTKEGFPDLRMQRKALDAIRAAAEAELFNLMTVSKLLSIGRSRKRPTHGPLKNERKAEQRLKMMVPSMTLEGPPRTDENGKEIRPAARPTQPYVAYQDNITLSGKDVCIASLLIQHNGRLVD